MKAEKLSSGKWRARAYNKYTGKRPSFTADTKKEAERMAREYEYNCGKSIDRITFGETLQLYLDSRKNILSPTTYTNYLSYQAHHYESLKDMDITDIDDAVLQQWANDFVINRSPKTASNVYHLITAVLRTRMPQKRFSVSLPTIGKPKLNLPSEAQINALLTAVKNTELCTPVYLATFCAMRRGEISALTLSDIDYAAKTITIDKNIVRGSDREWKIKSTKNGESRIILAPDIVLDTIKKHGLCSRHADYITQEFSRLLRKSNIKPFRFHDLRHFCAARMLSNGIPIAVVQEYGGWKDQDVLLQIYNYVIDEVRRKSMDNWNEFCKNFP